MRAKRQELRQLTTGETFDEATVRAKLTEIAAIEAKLMGEQFKIHQETLGVLTPEQKTELQQKREQFQNKWKERREQKAPGAVQ
jgi:Spy/CpxP family protein refolding chaperone